MDFADSPEHAAFRREFRDWLEANLPEDLKVEDAQDQRVSPDRDVLEMRARGPHLLAVDQEMVALVHGPGAQAGKVGAGARLGIALAPDLVAAEDLWQIALLLLLGAPVDQGRAQEAR